MTNLIAFYSEMTNSLHERRAVDTACLGFRHCLLWHLYWKTVEIRPRVDSGKWTKNCQTQRIMVSSMKSSGGQSLALYAQDWYCGKCSFISSLMTWCASQNRADPLHPLTRCRHQGMWCHMKSYSCLRILSKNTVKIGCRISVEAFLDLKKSYRKCFLTAVFLRSYYVLN